MDTIFGAPHLYSSFSWDSKLPIESPNSGLPSLFPYASNQCMAADDARKEIPDRPSPHTHTWRKSTKSEKKVRGKREKKKKRKKKAEKRDVGWEGGGEGVGKKGKENFRLKKSPYPVPPVARIVTIRLAVVVFHLQFGRRL